MTIELKHHYVAFLDILGFSNMVLSDIGTDNPSNLGKLYSCHQRAAGIFSENPSCQITQFSDSIVLAMPYIRESFEWFARKVGEYQRLLLDEGLLCRGGIVINKHFNNGTFTFSAGVIDAYMLESTVARYPRVVISQDLLGLVYPDQPTLPDFIIKEQDNIAFIDYLGITKNNGRENLEQNISSIVDKLFSNVNTSLNEKGIWLSSYSDAVLGTNLSKPRFSGANIS